jgi:hypothetical protein
MMRKKPDSSLPQIQIRKKLVTRVTKVDLDY